MNPRLINLPCQCGGVLRVVQCRSDPGRGIVDCECVCNVCGTYVTSQFAQQLLAQFAQPLWTPESEPTPEPEPDAPVIHGSVIGYRAFRILDWQLTGTYSTLPWVPGVNEAVCRPEGHFFGFNSAHLAPALGCACGITALARFQKHDDHWAAADVYGAIEAWSDETVPPVKPGDVADAAGVSTTTDVIAEIYGLPPGIVQPDPAPEEGGRFILHGTGFRAQYGKVVLLAVDDDWPAAKKAAVRALAREHEADVCKHAHLEDAAKEHGQLVPDDMLAWAKEGDPMAEVAGYSSGAFISPAWSTLIPQYFAGSHPQFQIYSHTTSGFSGGSPKRAKGPRPTGAPGICQTLGYPGPPADPTTKFRKRQRVRDSKGIVWACVKGGKPGHWEREEG